MWPESQWEGFWWLFTFSLWKGRLLFFLSSLQLPLNVRPHNQVTGVKFVSVLESLFLPFCLTPSSSLYFPPFLMAFLEWQFRSRHLETITSILHFSFSSLVLRESYLTFVSQEVLSGERERKSSKLLSVTATTSPCPSTASMLVWHKYIGRHVISNVYGKKKRKRRLRCWYDEGMEWIERLSLSRVTVCTTSSPNSTCLISISHLPPHLFIPHRHPLFSPYLLSLSLFDSRFTDLIKLMRW